MNPYVFHRALLVSDKGSYIIYTREDKHSRWIPEHEFDEYEEALAFYDKLLGREDSRNAH